MPSILKNGVVIATCNHLPDENDLTDRGETVIEETGEVGQVWDGVAFTTPDIPAPDVTVITKLQHIEQLELDALDDAFFQMLDSDVSTKRKFDAATELNIAHPLVQSFATAFGWDAVRLQQHFNSAGSL